jgi:hypothetical protein
MFTALKNVLGYKSQSQKDLEAADSLQKAFRLSNDAKIKLVNDEYERIKDNFLEKITEKMITYNQVVQNCGELCKKDFCKKDESTCDEITSMIKNRSNSEFVNLCKNVSDNNDELKHACSDANSQEFMIQQLFFMYKTNNKENVNNDADYNNIIFKEWEFYNNTHTRMSRDISKEYLRLQEQGISKENVLNDNNHQLSTPVLGKGGKRRTRRAIAKKLKRSSNKNKKTNHKKLRK